MAYVNVYDNGGGIRKVAVIDNARNIVGTTTDGGQTGANLAAELAALGVPSPSYSIGIPGTQGFGVGICDQPLPSYIAGLPGYNTRP